MNPKRSSGVCCIANGILTFFLLCILALAAGKTPYELLTAYSWGLILAVIISLVAAWRTYEDVQRLIAGNRSWLKPAAEGFILGFLPAPLTHVFGMLKDAFAAGSPWPSFGHSSFADWLLYMAWIIPWSALFGVVGGVYAMLLSGINRVILRLLQGNRKVLC